MNISDFEKYITSRAHCHLIGIGGVSMAPLAEVLHGMGITVTGSDINESPTVAHLRSLGIGISIGHKASNIDGADFIVRTAAARDDNVEIIAAHERDIPVFERAQAWGFIMRSYKNAICIAGTHGKTTTTSMVTQIFMQAQLDPTVMIGGTLPLIKAGHRVGTGDTIILESCEYYNSFHSFSPTVAVILNIDNDHLDFFGTFDNVKASFRKFASLVPDDGHIICNGDDENSLEALYPLNRELCTFGFGKNCRVRGINYRSENGRSVFDVECDGSYFAHIELLVPGIHNVKNALAASAVAYLLGIPPSQLEAGLDSFTGAGRRFEYKGTINGARVYDDYAHHPGELHALIDAVQTLDYSRVIVAFQPHTYSRTKNLFDDFVSELKRPDITLLAEVYAAREKNIFGISSADLQAKIPGAEFFPTFESMEDRLRELASPGDLIITVGAGDIFKVGEAIVE